ncbi:hypothetical protein F1C15_09220 [Frigoribacterium sp. NBH87]|uniref:TIR domain-containing protein n=1 Tax=Frigoribacterium sp. NBH87 TaxID=2596916 RepID=UPI001627CACC|nr:TIR domain-containing protein [Frigoribacterium sp. NBH87]QNE43958.1 hypothetical protein F1C15_09220 [Frigoribacterium sp. NBH87]
MAEPRAFLSFDFDHDATSRVLFAGQAKKDSPTPFTVQDWSSKRSLPEAQWERLIAAKIAATNVLIVLVGPTTYTATGVVKEIAFAKAANVPIFGVYVNGAGALTPLPTGLQRNRTIGWTWKAVAAVVDQALGEGKNA